MNLLPLELTDEQLWQLMLNIISAKREDNDFHTKLVLLLMKRGEGYSDFRIDPTAVLRKLIKQINNDCALGLKLTGVGS